MLHVVILHWGLIHKTSVLREAALCQGMPQGGGGGEASKAKISFITKRQKQQRISYNGSDGVSVASKALWECGERQALREVSWGVKR